MCQFQVKDRNTKQVRQCTFKGEPFCKRHTPKAVEAPAIPIDVETCMVCCEDVALYPTNCCEFKVCKSCVIKSGKAKCVHCAKDLDLDPITKDLMLFVKQKDDQIASLNQHVNILHHQIQLYQQPPLPVQIPMIPIINRNVQALQRLPQHLQERYAHAFQRRLAYTNINLNQ